jgi:hypothetical protein
MKGIEKLNLTKEQKRILEKSEVSFKRFARVYFEVIRIDEKEAIIKVWQQENPAQNYLSAKELIERTKGVFEGIIPAGVKIHCRPVPYEPSELRNLTIEVIKRDIEQFGLKPKDLVKLLDIDKSSLSLILSENRELSKANRAMFYYLLKYLTVTS